MRACKKCHNNTEEGDGTHIQVCWQLDVEGRVQRYAEVALAAEEQDDKRADVDQAGLGGVLAALVDEEGEWDDLDGLLQLFSAGKRGG